MVILILAIFFILCVYPLISIHKNKKYSEEGIEIGKKEGKKEGKIYNIPINVDTIKEGYPILCA